MGELAPGERPTRESLTEPAHDRDAGASHEHRSDEGGAEGDEQRCEQADLSFDEHEHDEFDQRNRSERTEEAHGRQDTGGPDIDPGGQSDKRRALDNVTGMSLRDLPSVHDLAATLGQLPERIRVLVAREAIEQARQVILDGGEADATAEATRMARTLARRRPTSIRNATGIVVHTNLGRVPLHPDAVAALSAAAAGYGNVEFDLTSGTRGGRGAWVRTLLTELTGAEDAHVVGNNAGALFAALKVLAEGKDVPVSRGELIEIGGSYRLPELMAASGARLVEVGTTNRTRTADYAAVTGPATGLILKVHPSNYQVVGFAEDAPLDELRAIADEADVPLVHDIGSGLLDEAAPWIAGGPPAWLRGEPGVRQSVEVAHLSMFSGDKLLGGPQAGIIVGTSDLVGRIRSHPLARAMRVDGPTLAALGATLELYADGRATELPIWAMALADGDRLAERAAVIADALGGTVEASASKLGGGSTPGMDIPSPVVRLPGRGDDHDVLLAADPPILARRDAGDLIVDLRALDSADDGAIVAALG